MGLGRTWAVALTGMTGTLVEVQADVGAGVPDATIIGSTRGATKEAKHRVKVALKRSGISWPNARLVVNFSPADAPKARSGFDLARAASMLCARGQITPDAARSGHLREERRGGRVQR